MREPLAPVEDVAARAAGTNLDDPEDVALVDIALRMVSAEVRYYGLDSWEPENIPPAAFNVVVSASARIVMNPGGYITERGDSVTFTRSEQDSVLDILNPSEIQKLQRISKRRGVISVTTQNSVSPIARSSGGRQTSWPFGFAPYPPDWPGWRALARNPDWKPYPWGDDGP